MRCLPITGDVFMVAISILTLISEANYGSGEMSGTGKFLFRTNNCLFSTNFIESEFFKKFTFLLFLQD
jgi:hypothetical protein